MIAYRNTNWATVGIFKFSSQTLEMSYFMEYEKSEKITLLSNIFQNGLEILKKATVPQFVFKLSTERLQTWQW